MLSKVSLATCFVVGLNQGYSQTASEVFSKTGVRDGLVAYIGGENTALLTSLHNQGNMVVSCQAKDEAAWEKAHKAVHDQGLFGLVSVSLPLTLERLPYPEHTVNLLVADLDNLSGSLGKPSVAEIKRVLAPFGRAYVKQGNWQVIEKGLPEGMDEWTHFFYNSTHNPVSNDTEVKPSTRLRWIGNSHVGGTNSQKGLFFHQGKMLGDMQQKRPGSKKTESYTYVVNAANGVPSWRKPFRFQHFPLLSHGKAFLSHKASNSNPKAKFLVIDLKTGEQRDISNLIGEPDPRYTSFGSKGSGTNHIIGLDDLILIPNHKKLFALDAKTMEVKWTHVAKDSAIVYHIADPVSKRIFLVEGPFHQNLGTRWLNGPLNYLVALNNEGKELWRNNEWVGKGGGARPWPAISQMTYFDNSLLVRAAVANISWFGDTFAARFNADNGKPIWMHHGQADNWRKYHPKLNDNAGSYGGVNYKNTSYWAEPEAGWPKGGEKAREVYAILAYPEEKFAVANTGGMKNSWDWETGAIKNSIFQTGKQENARCNRPFGTKNYLISHMTLFMGKDGTRSRNTITRSGCAVGAVPAYGAVHFVAGWCNCANFTYGRLALSSDPLQVPVPDTKRLVKTLQTGTKASSTYKQTANQMILDEWGSPFQFRYAEHEFKAQSGDLMVTAHKQENRITGTKNGHFQWSFLTGSRITHKPVIHSGKAFVGSHDGWLYALDVATGKLAWKFLAARNEEQIVAFGQMESRWPIYGVTMHNGRIYAAAGRTSEMDGGIMIWGLNPETGAIDFKNTLFSPTITDGRDVMTKSEKTIRGARNNARWVALRSEEGKLKMVLSSWDKGAIRGRSAPMYTLKEGLALEIKQDWKSKVIDPTTQSTVTTYIKPEPEYLKPLHAKGATAGLGWVKVPTTSMVSVELRDAQGRNLVNLIKDRKVTDSFYYSTHALKSKRLSGSYYLVTRLKSLHPLPGEDGLGRVVTAVTLGK